MKTVRIFLSSPGDVAVERAAVRDLLLGLARGAFVRGRVHIDVVSWDDPHGGAPMDARLTPQQAVDRSLPTPAQCDLTVVLLWGRMGTLLTETKADGTPYLSGTEWEFENALEADKPVLVYRRADKVLLDTEDPAFEAKLEQKRRVDRFFEQFAGDGCAIRRAHSTYASIEDLLTRVRHDVDHYLSRLLPDSVPPKVQPAPPALKLRAQPLETPLPPEPYPLLGPYAHPRTFAGRDGEVTALTALVESPQLILCMHGASGAGKSSVLLAGLVPRLRSDGYSVSIDRAPGDPLLGQRLLRDLLESSEALELIDDNPHLPASFAGWVAQASALSGKRLVFVLDQIDDVLRNPEKRERALAQIGRLIAATAQRLPGVQGFACKWMLCYRHEFHGEVRAWLEDVLVQARALIPQGLASLPFDLSDTQKSHDWVLPVMGKPRPGELGTGESKQAFLRAIVQPLELKENGRLRYPYVMPPDDAERLATAFAQVREAQPEAPLVPELQVVLGHLLQQARDSASTITEDGSIVVAVPSDQRLDAEIHRALAQHVERALNSAFPQDRTTAAGRSARTRAIMALGQLADAEGRRGEGLPEDDLTRMLGPDGYRVLARLSDADTRLVIVQGGRVALSHDRLAEVVAEIVKSEASRGNLVLDQALLDLQRIISQKLALHHSDPRDESALSLTRQQHQLIEHNQDPLLFDDARRAWWTSAALYRRRLARQRRRPLAVFAAVVLILLIVGGLLLRRQEQAVRRQEQVAHVAALQSELRGILANRGAEFERLAELVREHDYAWEPALLEGGFIDEINSEVFVSAPWQQPRFDPMQLISVIERSHPLFVESPSLFGAMSFALEEVRLRTTDSAVKQRALELSEIVRSAFVVYHLQNTSGFQRPPQRAADDKLNTWTALDPGEFMRDAADDISNTEHVPYRVRVSAFSIQQHEVTNEEYRRFDPYHTFPAGHEKHPVVDVSWYEAAAYAAWLNASLPTEAQWEYAARGTGTTKGRSYPWGNKPPNGTRVHLGTGTAPVGSHPAGRTPEGLDDMAGNAWEWCRDAYGPYWPHDSVDPLGPIGGKEAPAEERVIRGGWFVLNSRNLRADFRASDTPETRGESLGFRLVFSRLQP